MPATLDVYIAEEITAGRRQNKPLYRGATL
jgi:hypothetical protein